MTEARKTRGPRGASAAYDPPLPAGASLVFGDRTLSPADVCVWIERTGD